MTGTVDKVEFKALKVSSNIVRGVFLTSYNDRTAVLLFAKEINENFSFT